MSLLGIRLPLSRFARGGGARVLSSAADARPVLDHRECIVRAATREHGDPWSYSLLVYTGDRRGASTCANVFTTLIGADAVAGPYTLNGDFRRATIQSFYVESSLPIGQLQRVQIGHDSSDIGSGWFVDKVVVECHTTGVISEFPCDRWLGESDSGGANGPTTVELHEKESAVHRRRTADWPANARELKLVAAAATLPRTDKLRKGQRSRITASLGWGGEDAYFIAQGSAPAPGGKALPEATEWMLGVADGVGSWEASGIDAGKYSRSLMQAGLAHFGEVTGHAARHCGDPGAGSAVEEVVRLASADTVAAGVQGSSTLCIVHLDGTAATLTSANVGDSGFIVIRQGVVAYRSAQQEHSFGCPFQLGHHDNASAPQAAQISRLPVEPGDTVLLGSDGLFDNVSDAELAETVTALDAAAKAEGRGRDRDLARRLANKLVERALTASLNESQDTPFAKAATEEFGLVYRGGKQDDITVVVGLLNEAIRHGLPP